MVREPPRQNRLSGSDEQQKVQPPFAPGHRLVVVVIRRLPLKQHLQHTHVISSHARSLLFWAVLTCDFSVRMRKNASEKLVDNRQR